MTASTGGMVRALSPGNQAGQRIRARRRSLELTQADLAQRIGVSRQTVITMERGDYAPSVYLALRVARTLDTTVELLWAEDPGQD